MILLQLEPLKTQNKMLRKIIFILSVFLFSYNLNAQVYYGFKVGANISNISGDNVYNGMKGAMHVGAVAEIAVSDLFSIQPELLYSMQGSQDSDDSSFKNNNHYITVPVMIKYFINETMSIDAGPQIGYLVFAKTSNGWEEWVDTKDQLNAFDYGFNIGASYEMDNGMNINIRYNYNFANIYKSNDFDLKANNTVIQISLGYKFY